MKLFTDLLDPKVSCLLLDGGIVVARTDTLYGVLAVAADERAVQHVYDVKGRDDNKPPIVLISRIDQLYDDLSQKQFDVLHKYWPGKISAVVESSSAPLWIRRGGTSVAYRLPEHRELRQLIELTGQLVAPSANPQSKSPAMTIEQAIAYFGDKVDAYVDGGEVKDAAPSKLYKVQKGGDIERLR